MANLTVTDTQLNKMTQSIRGAINEKYGSMREAFKAIDTDRSGKLSRREIMRAVASFQLNIPREHLLQLMQARAPPRARAAPAAAPSLRPPAPRRRRAGQRRKRRRRRCSRPRPARGPTAKATMVLKRSRCCNSAAATRRPSTGV